MRKLKKSKIVLVSVLGLGAISIGSVGFATWLVGINKTTDYLKVVAKVDSSVNDSKYIDIQVADEEFHIAEKAPIGRDDTHIVGASASGDPLIVSEDALSFNLTKLQVLIGKGVTKMPTKVKLELLLTDNEFNRVDATKDLIKDCTYSTGATSNKIGERTASPLTYLTYVEELSLTDSNYFTDDTKENESFYTYNFNSTKYTRTMSWGSYFTYSENTTRSPATYYNTLYTRYTTNGNTMSGAEKFIFADQINKEITALNTAFTDKQLTITASLL